MEIKGVAESIVDDIFEKYDQDQNGYLDKEEAKVLFATSFKENQNDFESHDEEKF